MIEHFWTLQKEQNFNQSLMFKQNMEIPSHLNNYLIPRLKNKITRTSFSQKVRSWLQVKLKNIFIQDTRNQLSSTESETIDKKCQQIQKQFRLKYSLNYLLPKVKFQYFETIILYVMQKKLYWIYKPQNSLEDQYGQKHYQIQVQFNLKLKKMYKDFQYQIYKQKNETTSQKFKRSDRQNSFNNSSKHSIKKVDSDFQYNFLLILSVCFVSAFFQHFFKELQIDNSFRSQIYVILNHAFLDLQVSPNVYDIMRKKYTFQEKVKEHKSLNVSQLNQKQTNQSLKQQSVLKKSLSRKETLLGNYSLLNQIEEKPSINRIQNLSKEQISNRGSKEVKDNSTSIHRMNSTVGFSSLGSQKVISKKSIFIKPTSSVQQSVSLKNSCQKISKFKSKKSLHNNQPNQSRFNSFLRDARQFNVPSILKQTYGQNYLPSEQVIDFYSTIKTNLHVDSLPPLVKKKMNINQYQKLNQLNNLQEIKREVNSLDNSSKKNHMKSNDLSLAMNTFISASNKIPKKKRHQTHIQIVQNSIQNQNQPQQVYQSIQKKQQTSKDQKNQLQLRKLPIKASNLKLPYQKSATIYQFTDEISTKDSKRSNKKYQILSEAFQLLSKKKQTEAQKIDDEQKEMQRSLQDKKKRNPCEWKNYLNLLKKHQSKENIVTFLKQQQKKLQQKKNLSRKSYLRQKQEQKNHIISASNSILQSSKQIKLDNQSTKKYQQSKIIQNSKKPFQSMNTSSVNVKNQSQTFQERSKKQSRNLTQIHIMQEDCHQSQQNFKYSSLEGQVNIHRQSQQSNIEKYDSFELKKRFKQFQNNCKLRDQKINYSIFKINHFKI